jgi:hypothetical protein
MWLAGLALASRFEAGMALAQPMEAAVTVAPRQTQADDYTAYELLAPDRQQFRILYDVTATTPGARFFFNAIRKGSEATDERVLDLATGAALKFEVVSGEQARREGLPGAALDTDYIKIWLPRPVPAQGEVRLRIDKTYRDAKSYYREGDAIVFSRSLGIKRNRIVLPPGYELAGCNMPSQVFTEADGRVAVSFFNANPDAATVAVRGRPLPASSRIPADRRAGPAAPGPAPPPEPPVSSPTLEQSAVARIAERAFQDREIVYFLQPPATHAFSLYHDYTESRDGVGHYLNVVRPGSTVSDPSAVNLDTGEPLSVETLKGPAITAAKIEIGEPVRDDTEVVVIRFPPVKKGQSTRLRISETYTDPARYGLVGDMLVWRRSFGRPRNAIVLPEGWYLTASSVPATVTMTEDGRVRLDYVNARPDSIDVLVRAAKR